MSDDWEFINIPHRRWFHYEAFPGFIGPKGRRCIFFQWVYLLLYNTWSYIIDRPVYRTLIEYKISEWLWWCGEIEGRDITGWHHSKTNQFIPASMRSFEEGPPE